MPRGRDRRQRAAREQRPARANLRTFYLPAVALFNMLNDRVEEFTVDINDVSGEVVAYVLTLRGTNVPGKAPEGEPVAE